MNHLHNITNTLETIMHDSDGKMNEQQFIDLMNSLRDVRTHLPEIKISVAHDRIDLLNRGVIERFNPMPIESVNNNSRVINFNLPHLADNERIDWRNSSISMNLTNPNIESFTQEILGNLAELQERRERDERATRIAQSLLTITPLERAVYNACKPKRKRRN